MNTILRAGGDHGLGDQRNLHKHFNSSMDRHYSTAQHSTAQHKVDTAFEAE